MLLAVDVVNPSMLRNKCCCSSLGRSIAVSCSRNRLLHDHALRRELHRLLGSRTVDPSSLSPQSACSIFMSAFSSGCGIVGRSLSVCSMGKSLFASLLLEDLENLAEGMRVSSERILLQEPTSWTRVPSCCCREACLKTDGSCKIAKVGVMYTNLAEDGGANFLRFM